MRLAFRNLGIRVSDWCLLVMKAVSPFDKKVYYFVDKCLPFGSSISCAHFQHFSNAVGHIVSFRTGKKLVNYLDDYLFVALLKLLCNTQVKTFLWVCNYIQFPVSMEKTFWGCTQLTFLGMLIDSVRQTVLIPRDKVLKALNLIQEVLQKDSRKITVKALQKFCGLLNFLCHCIVPGRAFTRRLYAHTAGKTMKPHHHLKISQEMRLDLQAWEAFLKHPAVFCQSFIDFSKLWEADEVQVFSDASRNFQLGMGGISEKSWLYTAWEQDFMTNNQPSIAYLELYAVLATVLTWGYRYANDRIVLFCDNEAAVFMINNSTSNCKNCMVLIHLLVLHSMVINTRVFTRYIQSKANRRSDQLSRLKIKQFREENPDFDAEPTDLPKAIWPMSKVWLK